MDKDQLVGRLERVNLRDVWPSEPDDFTPWLAKPDNINLLGDTLGIELEVEGTEYGVGEFSADIVCKDIATEGQRVVIENQLNQTDHDHLGKLMTYAAGLEASTIIWIASGFREEHRAVLDWLNEIVSDNVQIFGVTIELIRIGNSPIAPNFNIVVKPNDWIKSSKKELSETKKLQLDFWRELNDLIKQSATNIKPRSARPQHWQNFSIGKADFTLRPTIDTRNTRICIRLVISGNNAKDHYSQLSENKEQIEQNIGNELEWRELPQNLESQINLNWEGCDPSDRSLWKEQHEWLLKNLDAFLRTFTPLIRALDT